MDTDTKPSIRWLATLSLILSWGLASCAPSVIAQGQPKPTANAASAYPGPTSVHPLPTQANGKIDRSAGLLVTPLPDEKVQLGAVTEIQSLPPELQLPETTRFSTKSWEQGEGQNAIKALAVVDTLTNREVRLGNDTGYATFRGRSAEVIIWKWECECGDPKPGLYAYLGATDKNIFI